MYKNGWIVLSFLDDVYRVLCSFRKTTVGTFGPEMTCKLYSDDSSAGPSTSTTCCLLKYCKRTLYKSKDAYIAW
jgi:hypothetical protein